MMMVLGLYVFMLRTVPYQELQYQRSWRHAANSRVNRRPSTQFLGPENDMLTLSGVLMPEITGGRLSLLALEQMAEQGKAWPLIEGSGTIYGMYVIEGLNQTKTEFFRDGMPRRIEFTLSLKRVDESLSDMFGDLSAQLNNLQDTATSALSDISKRSRAITWWVRMKTCWYLIALMPTGATPNERRKCSGNACNAALRHFRYNWQKGGQISTRKCL